jgi:LmbE family N-acetylglucosaminyl deacetylase
MVTHVFISPHFDDAVGSCAGAIWRLRASGCDVQALTIFGGLEHPPYSDVASVLHQAWGFDEVVVARRREDETAFRILDCRSGFLEFRDSIYRTDASGRHLYPTFQSLSAGANELDRDLPARIAERLDQTVPANDVIVYCPAAVGKHVDHVITRRAVEILHSERVPLIYYREFYYDRFADGPPPPKSQIVTVTLEPDEVAVKLSAFAAYQSQIKCLFDDEKGMHRYFTTNGRVEEFFVPHTTPPALRDELLHNLRARVVSRRLRTVVQVLTIPSRRWRAAALLSKVGSPGNTPAARVRRLISRKIRSVRGLIGRMRSRSKQ